MATKKTDQIRRLTNSVTLAGYLADIESKQGVDKNGVDYIRIRGQIQCGEESVMTRSFTSFIKAKKADGTDSENYEKVLDWVKKAVPMTRDKENATMVKLVGSLSANDYVGSDEQLHEGTVASMQFFNDFEEFACDLDIEGYIKSITDEERGPEDDKKPTGRKRLNLISMDFYHNALDIKNIIPKYKPINVTSAPSPIDDSNISIFVLYETKLFLLYVFSKLFINELIFCFSTFVFAL